MKRYRVDTNLLIRFFTQDDAEQAAKVAALFLEAEQGGCLLLVSPAVLTETVWVLLKAYKQPRETVANGLTSFLEKPSVVCDDQPVMLDTLARFRVTKLAIVDCLIAAQAAADGDVVATFDKGIGKAFDDVELWGQGA